MGFAGIGFKVRGLPNPESIDRSVLDKVRSLMLQFHDVYLKEVADELRYLPWKIQNVQTIMNTVRAKAQRAEGLLNQLLGHLTQMAPKFSESIPQAYDDYLHLTEKVRKVLQDVQLAKKEGTDGRDEKHVRQWAPELRFKPGLHEVRQGTMIEQLTFMFRDNTSPEMTYNFQTPDGFQHKIPGPEFAKAVETGHVALGPEALKQFKYAERERKMAQDKLDNPDKYRPKHDQDDD
jgi:hypothetical protein